MRKKKFCPRSITAITALLAAIALVLWLVCMYCVTSVTAEYAAARYIDDHRNRASTIATRSFDSWLERDVPYENYRKSKFWEAVSLGTFSSGSPVIGGDSGFIGRRSSTKSFSATAIYDAEGNCVERSWDDFFFFEYLTQEQWTAGEERSHNNARALFDRAQLTETGRELLNGGSMSVDVRAMRFTGTFDGIEFTPTRIDYINGDDFRTALHTKGSGPYTVSGVVNAYDLQWITIYEASNAVPAGTETVTLYSDWIDLCFAQASPSFSYKGTKYDGIDALVEELGPTLSSGYQYLTRYEGLDLLILSVNYCESYDGETYYDSYYYGEGAYADEAPEMHFYTVSAVYCSPWRTAFGELRNVYVFTFLLTLLLVLYVRSVVKRHLIRPIQLVSEALLDGRDRLEKRPNEEWNWREERALEQGFEENNDRQRTQQNEITRLNTALDYASDAEQNRRQMTSSIAHELKTPLAVIHSYAEGLKEHIAEGKREKYIDVILAESEHLDSMVLELLDLSRLEAGKVKLSVEDFSLSSLAQSVFERLEMAAQAKNLTITYDFPDDCTVTADEARIRQVVENFAANAVKYTPAGGGIRVKIKADRYRTSPRTSTTFSIENDSAPLSDEELRKVWDTFYRADESRSGGGTGLGLAIAKNIVELHGGTCSVQNTKTGVLFQFSI